MQHMDFTKRLSFILIFGLLNIAGCDEHNQASKNIQSTATETDATVALNKENDDTLEEFVCVTPEVEGYARVGCLHDGLAGVIKVINTEYEKIEKVGYVNAEGQLIIPAEYDAIYTDVWVGEGEFNDFSQGLVAVSKDYKWGFLDTQGNTVIPLNYAQANNFKEGLAVVSNEEGYYGAINKDNKSIIPFDYTYLKDFSDGVAVAQKDSTDPENHDILFGLIDKDNKAVIPFMYEEMGDLSEGLIAVRQGEKWGYINRSNQVIIPIELPYVGVHDFSDGLAAVFAYESGNSDNIEYGYINKKAELVIPIQYPLPYEWYEPGTIDFIDGVAIVHKNEETIFCIDKSAIEVQCPNTGHSNSVIDHTLVSDEYIDEGISNTESTTSDEPEFATVTDALALKTGSNWTWDDLANLPNIQEWREQTPIKNAYIPDDPNYSINAALGDHSYMMAYGTQSQPKIILLSSGQGIMEDETLSGIARLEDYFRNDELTHIPSNCEITEDYGNNQKFYKWERSGYKPLYVYATSFEANAGVKW